MDRAELIGWLVVFPIITMVIFIGVHYGFIHMSKMSCDAMEGDFTVYNDGIFQVTKCETTQSIQIENWSW